MRGSGLNNFKHLIKGLSYEEYLNKQKPKKQVKKKVTERKPEKQNKVTLASDCTCCHKKCKDKAVAFWPIIDPDIPSHPYCRKHLDEAKFKLMAKLFESDRK